MNLKNKQRIIGIVILAAFAALLIPFLFTSGIGKKITNYDQIPMNPEQRQLATKQIEATSDIVIPPKQPETSIASNQTLVVSEPEVSAASVTENQKNSSVATNEHSSDVSLPPELSSNNQAPLPPLPALQNDAELAAKTSGATAVTTTPEPEAITTEEPLQPQKKIDEALLMDKMIKKSASAKIKTQDKIETAPIVANKKNTKSTKKPSPKTANIKKAAIKKTGNWSIQVGSFTSSLGVNKLVGQLRNKGFKAYLQKVTKNGVVMTRVLVGSEADKQTAKQIADKLSADLNIIGHLVRS